MTKSESIANRLWELELNGQTETAEYIHLKDKYPRIKSKEISTWTKNWKKNNENRNKNPERKGFGIW
jgi:hypothetical protein